MNGSHQSVPQGSRQSYKPSYRAEESAHTYEADQVHADVKCLVRSQYCSVVLEDADERLFRNILRTVKWFMEIVFFFFKKNAFIGLAGFVYSQMVTEIRSAGGVSLVTPSFSGAPTLLSEVFPDGIRICHVLF